MGSINARCETGNGQPWTLQLSTPPSGKLSETIMQLKFGAMEHINQCLAQQGSSLADDLDMMEETLSGDDEAHPTHQHKRQK